MSPEYPYQLVLFLDKEPAVGEGVYQGENGWYPQITLKRRFKHIDEPSLLVAIGEFVSNQLPLEFKTGQLIKPERMPVRVIEVVSSDSVRKFHRDLIEYMGSNIESRYPERDGDNYLPHITAEYEGSYVIPVDNFTNRLFKINTVCLVKDAEDRDSHVVAYF